MVSAGKVAEIVELTHQDHAAGADASAVPHDGHAGRGPFNGLLPQYFPEGTDLNLVSDGRLREIAAELNERPRACLRTALHTTDPSAAQESRFGADG
jgi:hypothetical protein